jgi:hypothetical protein
LRIFCATRNAVARSSGRCGCRTRGCRRP